jgi:hypothetical protein
VGHHFTEKESFCLPAQYPLEKLAIELDLTDQGLKDLLTKLAELELIDPGAWAQKRIFIPKMAERCDKYTEKLHRDGKLNLPNFNQKGPPKKSRKPRNKNELAGDHNVPTKLPQTDHNVPYIKEQKRKEKKRKEKNKDLNFNFIEFFKNHADPECSVCGGIGYHYRENAVVGPKVIPCECFPDDKAMWAINKVGTQFLETFKPGGSDG